VRSGLPPAGPDGSLAGTSVSANSDEQYPMNKTVVSGFLAFVIVSLAAGSARGETGEQPKSRCSVISAAGSIRVVVCPPDLDQDALHVAGQEACGEELICNAWIWDSAEKAPKNSPRTDSDIAQEYAREAIAIWANDSKALMLVKRLNK
jgi:hypothetical protein